MHVSSPLALEGWLEFNRLKWGVEPDRLSYCPTENGVPSLSTVLYMNKRGRLVVPPLNPYLPFEFTSTPTEAPYRLTRQWLDVSKGLAEKLKACGVAGALPLPPSIGDVRPFQWAGYRLEARYTYTLSLPVDMSGLDHAVRKNINKAKREGYTVKRVHDLEQVMKCLHETESRQEFTHRLTLSDLQLADRLLTAEHFRTYICYAPNGDAASARIVLHVPGGQAVDWVAGTRTEHLTSGATQLLIWETLSDLTKAGATSFDYGGANLPSVSAAKANWGGTLTPYYVIIPYGYKQLARWLWNWWCQLRGGR